MITRRTFLPWLLVSVLFTAPILACNRPGGGSNNPPVATAAATAGASQDPDGDQLDQSMQNLDKDMGNADTLTDVPQK